MQGPRLKLKEYPYTYVRTVVARSLLLSTSDYEKLLKMGFFEIAEFLQGSQYREEISRLSDRFSGAELIERSLSENLAATLAKIKRISTGEVSLLVDAYLKRYEAANIKAVIRAISINKREIGIVPIGSPSPETLRSLTEKGNISEALLSQTVLSGRKLEKVLRHFEEAKSLSVIENALDQEYYKLLSALIERIEGAPTLKRYFNSEVLALNIITILKLKKEGVDRKTIGQHLIGAADDLSQKLMSSRSVDDAVAVLGSSKLSDATKDGAVEYRESGTLIGIERDLHVWLLRTARLLSHQSPLSAEVIIGFMFAKEIEVKNIEKIVKGKQMEMPTDMIRRFLAIDGRARS